MVQMLAPAPRAPLGSAPLRSAPSAAGAIRRRGEQQGLHVGANASKRRSSRRESPDERQQLVARHFEDTPQLRDRIPVLVHPEFAVRILLGVHDQQGGGLPSPFIATGS